MVKIVLTVIFLIRSFNSIAYVSNLYEKYTLVADSSSSGNTFFFGEGGLRFKFRVVQIGHSVANGSPPLQYFFERSCIVHKRITGRRDLHYGWWWYYPTPSEGWERGGTPRRPNNRAIPQGLDQKSRTVANSLHALA